MSDPSTPSNQLTRHELIGQISENTGLPKETARTVLGVIEDTLTEALGQGRPVRLLGLGKLAVREMPPRAGVMNGRAYALPARRRVLFSASKGLKEAVNDA
jgi:DNA-binding protein HU-beta